MKKELIQEAMIGSDNPKELLRKVGIIGLQKKAASELITDATIPPSIEDYWQNSPYSKKPNSVRFVSRVVTDWLNEYVKSYSMSFGERDALERKIYVLMGHLKG